MPIERSYRSFQPDFSWDGVDRLAYKQDDAALFKSITRQVLFEHPDLRCELRYFDIAPGGFSTLERHHHVHAVMILRGRGRALVGESVRDVAPFDLVTIPSLTWHQFRAASDQPLGFLCMVNAERDKPQLPTEDERQALLSNPVIAAFLSNV